MSRVAIFVDAGYLFAQGSEALAGTKQQRANMTLDVRAAIAELHHTRQIQGVKQALLRTYWYDGARGSSILPSDHAEIAHTPYVKLRLGMINGAGQQKGVDSLIVTDLIELARNRAIDDAVLLSGDDDIRVGVTIAQAFGVCVHLIGIAPSIGSQSPLLMQEVDTTFEWGKDVVSKFLSVRSTPSPSPSRATPETRGFPIAAGGGSLLPPNSQELDAAIRSFVEQIPDTQIQSLSEFWSNGNHGVPSDVDRTLLGQCRSQLKRTLDQDETKHMRARFTALVKARRHASDQEQHAP